MAIGSTRTCDPSRMKIHILTTRLPPNFDGIADHTRHIATGLAASAEVTTLISRSHPFDPIPGVEIAACYTRDDFASLQAVAERVAKDRSDWLILQYAPVSLHSTEWAGRQWLGMIRRCKSLSPNIRFAIIVHETEPQIIAPRNPIRRWLGRSQLSGFLHVADLIISPLNSFIESTRARFPEKKYLLHPVGSNIPRVHADREIQRQRFGFGPESIVLGLFGRGNPSRILDRVELAESALRESGFQPVIFHVGKDDGAMTRRFKGKGIIQAGMLPPEETSRTFSAMDIYLAPYNDGVSFRRSSLLAAMQHGLPIVGTIGGASDPLFIREQGNSMLLAPLDSPEAFAAHALALARDAELRRRIGCAAESLFNREFSWERIVSDLSKSLNV